MNYIFNDSTMSSLNKGMLVAGLFFISFAIFCVTPYGQIVLELIGVIAVLILGLLGFILLTLLLTTSGSDLISTQQSTASESKK